MAQRVGDPLPSLNFYIRRNGKHGAIIDWYLDDAQTIPQTQLDGAVMQIIVGDRANPVKVYTTTSVVGNRATWHFSQEDTDLPFDLYDGLILLDDNGDQTPMANLKLIVEPG